jgi:ArsR family transcriptional regulator
MLKRSSKSPAPGTAGGQSSPCCRVIHARAVTAARRHLPESEALLALADFFRLFGDGTRIGILWALSRTELCVCDLSALLDMTQSAVSHQLRVLKQAHVVKYRRSGKTVFYSLDDEHIGAILALGRSHVGE